jgi:hypothetical protein
MADNEFELVVVRADVSEREIRKRLADGGSESP